MTTSSPPTELHAMASTPEYQWAQDHARMTFRQFLSQVREDWIVHGRDWTVPGFRAVAVHRFGNWRMNIRFKLLRAPFSMLYRRWFRKCRNVYGIEIPWPVRLGRRVLIAHQHGIVIHGNSVIGDECIIRHGVTLGIKTPDRPDQAPIVGNRVDIGAGAVILGRITIGDGAKIGANSVVLMDIPPGATAVGIPAKVVRTRQA